MGAPDVDAIVIGAGLAGAAVLRDLARRGARALLLEQRDLLTGGSIAGHGTIDLRDLALDGASRAVVAAQEAREREESWLVASAPHLATRVPVLSPAEGARRGPALLAAWDARLALRARGGRSNAHVVLDARAARRHEPALVLDDDRGALLTTRVRFDALRLVTAMVRDAEEQGAEVRTREEVVAIVPEAGGVLVRSRASGVETETRARVAILATGAWPRPGTASTQPRERRMHLVIEHAITTHAIVLAAGSIVPFHNASVVSGPSRPFEGELATSGVTRDEVRALLAVLARHVPDLREARVVSAYASVRRAASATEVEPPIYALAPGTPWDVRARAEVIGARIAKVLGLATDPATLTTKLPGGEEITDSFVVAERLALPEPTARRLVLRHGARCLDLGARIGKRRTEAAVVCACEPVLEAEVRHAVRAEHARDVGDVGRRTCLGHGACGGMRCAHRAAEIVASERALAPREAHEMARRFLVERWRERVPALDPASLAQEELAHARWVSAGASIEPESAE